MADKLEFPDTMIMNCFYKRLLFSPEDAIYCARFFEMILRLQKLPYWNVIKNIKKFVALIIPSIHCITKKEAYNVGIFLFEIFQLIEGWFDRRKL